MLRASFEIVKNQNASKFTKLVQNVRSDEVWPTHLVGLNVYPVCPCQFGGHSSQAYNWRNVNEVWTFSIICARFSLDKRLHAFICMCISPINPQHEIFLLHVQVKTALIL